MTSPSVEELEEEEQDVYVERDASQAEEVLVEAQTMAVTKPPRSSKVGRSTSYVANQTYGQREERRSYSDLPLPPSPRLSGRSSREGGRRWQEPASDEEEAALQQKRMPRPPVRRRHRGKPSGERPKSAPPEKYSAPVLATEHRREVIHLPDLSDGETSDTGGGTLETVSAKSINFVRPSQRLLEREQHKRLKRHKSFFNADSLFSKKSSAVRRAESFHQGFTDYPLSGTKQAARDEARERAKSVDRLLMPGEEDPLVGRLIKSKSMEFLKSKILRRPSKASRKAPSPPPARLPDNPLLGRSMFELHRSPSRQTRPYPDWEAPSVLPSAPREPRRREQPAQYDWRQDTPFWRGQESRSRSRLSETPPPTWTPPPPQQYRPPALPPSYPSMSVPSVGSGLYLGESRGMYLPSSPAPPPYTPGDALLEITELEDAPPGRDYTVYTHNHRHILHTAGGLY